MKEDKLLFDLDITFYSDAFHLNKKDKNAFIELSKKIINIISDSSTIDINDPLIRECIFKSAIFCIQSNNGTFIKFSKEESENNIKNYALISRIDIQKNFKDLHRNSTIFSNIKDFINRLSISEKEITKLPLEVINSWSAGQNFRRKLDEMHNSFFDCTDLSFLFKKLIWDIFICLINENELKSSTLDKTKLFFAICQDILIRIPNIFYPRKFGKKMTTIFAKKNIIKEYFKKYMSDDIDNQDVSKNIKNLYSKIGIFNEEISLDGVELSDQKKIENILNKLNNYYEKNILNKLNYDQRLILFENEIYINNSPKIKNDIFSRKLENNITCNRALFIEEKKSEKLENLGFNIKNNPLKRNQTNLTNEKESILMMTTYTRVWSLLSWAKGVLKNYKKKSEYISKLQKNYKPKYLSEREYNKFIPIDSYAKKYIDELILLLKKYKVNSNFEIDLIQFYIYCLSLLIENDTNIFSENFSALLLYNDDFIKASAALSFELALTIFDIEEIELNTIYEYLKLDVYDLWKIILPSNLNLCHVEIQKHLEEIDYQISIFLIWRNPSDKFKKELKDFLDNENIVKDEKEKKSIYKLILQESAQQSTFLCHNKKDFEIPFINENFKKKSTNNFIYKDSFEYVDNYNKVIGVSILLQRLIIYCIKLNQILFDNFYQENNETKKFSSNPIVIDEYIKKESELITKVILTNYEDISILWGLHIDQFVLCCIILVLEKYNLFSFINIKNENTINDNNDNSSLNINKNILHNSYIKSKLFIKGINEDSQIFNHVKLSNKKFVNLIDFYKEKFKIKFMKYYKDIKSIKIKSKIDYFNVHEDFESLLKFPNPPNKSANSFNEDSDEEFDFLEKPKKKLKISEKTYLLSTDNKVYESESKNNEKIDNNNKISFDSKNSNIEDSISLLKKLKIKNNNELYFDLFKEEKYLAYRNDNLKKIYSNIIKFEMPSNEDNRKISKEKLNKLKGLFKGKSH